MDVRVLLVGLTVVGEKKAMSVPKTADGREFCLAVEVKPESVPVHLRRLQVVDVRGR